MRNKLIIAVLTLATFWVVFYYGFKRVDDYLWLKRKQLLINAVDKCMENAKETKTNSDGTITTSWFNQDTFNLCMEQKDYAN